MQDEVGEQAPRVLIRAEHRIEPQRRQMNTLALGRLTAEQGGGHLGNGVVTVGFDGFAFRGGMVLEAVFRGGARVNEGLEAGLQARRQQAHCALDIGAHHLVPVGLPGVGAMRCKVEDPVRPDLADDAGDSFRVVEVQFVETHVRPNLLDAPRLVIGPDQQVKFMALAQQPSREVSAHKAGAASQDNALHFRLASSTTRAQPDWSVD